MNNSKETILDDKILKIKELLDKAPKISHIRYYVGKYYTNTKTGLKEYKGGQGKQTHITKYVPKR